MQGSSCQISCLAIVLRIPPIELPKLWKLLMRMETTNSKMLNACYIHVTGVVLPKPHHTSH